jgi:hypothetical protein
MGQDRILERLEGNQQAWNPRGGESLGGEQHGDGGRLIRGHRDQLMASLLVRRSLFVMMARRLRIGAGGAGSGALHRAYGQHERYQNNQPGRKICHSYYQDNTVVHPLLFGVHRFLHAGPESIA